MAVVCLRCIRLPVGLNHHRAAHDDFGCQRDKALPLIFKQSKNPLILGAEDVNNFIFEDIGQRHVGYIFCRSPEERHLSKPVRSHHPPCHGGCPFDITPDHST